MKITFDQLSVGTWFTMPNGKSRLMKVAIPDGEFQYLKYPGVSRAWVDTQGRVHSHFASRVFDFPVRIIDNQVRRHWED
jgi:hypothetical protein